MQIVIEIDNEHYERIMRLEEGVTVYPTTLALYEAVKNGTPFPKGHGRLIDADAFFKSASIKFYTTNLFSHIISTIDNAPTVIEADKEEQDE